MTVPTTYQMLGTEELRQWHDRLARALICDCHVLHGDPFQASAAVVFEEFGLWRRVFFERLQAVLQRSGGHALQVARYRDRGGSIEFVRGVRLPAALDWDTYQRLGFELDFTGNGADNYLFDDTCEWLVGTVVDVQFTGGSEAAMDAWFGPRPQRLALQAAFAQWAADPALAPAYRAMPAYVRP